MTYTKVGTSTTAAAESKSIILFSDGTGNSSAKLFKTNVWRMYEAVDLGPTSEGKRKQIAFYDNGVGTSALRPLAMLAGIFGFGLKRNVLEIYRYACRNYRPAQGQHPHEDAPAGGDEIYGFGFSRGAFTMRVVIALIADQGLVVAADERELQRKSRDAYRAYRSAFLPRKWSHPTRLWRWARTQASNGWRAVRKIERYQPGRNFRPIIRFVGVWDTVAAYGGPIVEITRGIDDWIYALSMPNYRLSHRVRCARHALAIDDERDAFHPLLWDELAEARLRERHPAAEAPWLHPGPDDDPRLQQVWFTGMHADVGGGYPDESLSYVSFLWMKNEAEKAGLRTVKVVTDRYRALANSAGPIHDSRSGPAAYYRYQPRNIGAWVHPADADSIVTDPELKDDKGNPRGLLEKVQVHESVLARIATGTDGYAPYTLPADIRVVPPQPGDETAQQADTETPQAPPAEEQEPRWMLPPALRARLEDGDVGQARAAAMAAVWDHVWIRRITYFVTLFLTIALVLMPWWVGQAPDPPVLTDGRTWLGAFIRMLAVVTPDFLDPLIDSMADNVFYFLLLAGAIGLLMWRSKRRERRLRDLCRGIWAQTLAVDGPPPAAPQALWVRGPRTSKAYRRPMRFVKWRALPLLAALALLALLLWLLLGLFAQARLPALERSDALCDYGAAAGAVELARIDFSPAASCQPVGLSVERDQRYIVEFEVVEPWKDGRHDADPAGLDAVDLGFAGYAGVPLRRVITANYMQPVIEIRTADGRVHIGPLTLRQQGDSAASWRGEFVARRSGALALFANEAVLPWAPHFFYRDRDYGNAGTACVTIRRADRAGDLPELPPPGTACAAADERADAARLRRETEEQERRQEAEARKRRATAAPPPEF